MPHWFKTDLIIQQLTDTRNEQHEKFELYSFKRKMCQQEYAAGNMSSYLQGYENRANNIPLDSGKIEKAVHSVQWKHGYVNKTNDLTLSIWSLIIPSEDDTFPLEDSSGLFWSVCNPLSLSSLCCSNSLEAINLQISGWRRQALSLHVFIYNYRKPVFEVSSCTVTWKWTTQPLRYVGVNDKSPQLKKRSFLKQARIRCMLRVNIIRIIQLYHYMTQ